MVTFHPFYLVGSLVIVVLLSEKILKVGPARMSHEPADGSIYDARPVDMVPPGRDSSSFLFDPPNFKITFKFLVIFLRVSAYVCWLGGGGKLQSKAFVDDVLIVIMHSPPSHPHTHHHHQQKRQGPHHQCIIKTLKCPISPPDHNLTRSNMRSNLLSSHSLLTS